MDLVDPIPVQPLPTTITTIETERTVPTNDNDATFAELAREQDAGREYADKLIEAGPTSDETKQATNRTIDYFEQIRVNTTDIDLQTTATHARDFWSVLGDMHDGVTPGVYESVNFANWTPRLMLDVWADWSASGQRTSVIDWIIQTGAGP